MDIFNEYKDVLKNKDWKFVYDEEKDIAKLVNSFGQEIDHRVFGYALDLLKNRLYDIEEQIHGPKSTEPIDEFTKRRIDINCYSLIKHDESSHAKHILEAYSYNTFPILFGINGFTVYNGRIVEREDIYLDVDEAKKLLKSLTKFIEENN